MKKILLVVPATALAFSVVAACGSSDDKSGSSDNSSAAAAPKSSMSSDMPSMSSSDMPSMSMSGGVSKNGTMSIVNFKYKLPATVSPGEKLKVTNADGVAHTITLEKAKIDVKIAANGTATVTAPDKAGTYPITCDYHSNMHADMVVK